MPSSSSKVLFGQRVRDVAAGESWQTEEPGIRIGKSGAMRLIRIAHILDV
jgi:hypothetical protein